MAERKNYSVIKAYTSKEFKEKLKNYSEATGKKEGQIIREAVNKLINGKK